MNNIKYLVLLLIGLVVIACSKEEVTPSTVTRFQTFDIKGLPDKIEVPEIDTSIFITVTFDDNQIFNFDLDITPGDNSTATENVDYAVEHSVSVATLAKTATFEFQVGSDQETEGDESVFLTLSSSSPSGLPKSKTIEIVIKDRLDPTLYLDFNWDATNNAAYPGCAGMDMDILIYTAAGDDTGIYDGATAACTESVALLDELPDGDYLIAANNWANKYKEVEDTVAFPIKITAYKQGKIDAEFVTTDNFTNKDPDSEVDKGNLLIVIMGLRIEKGVFTIIDQNDMQVAKGFKPNNKIRTKR